MTRKKTVSGKENAEANSGAELNIKAEDARSVASLHRYAPSRNTTLGLISPYDAATRSGEPRQTLSSRLLQLYPALPHVVLFYMHRSVMNKLRLPDEGEDMQDLASSVPRIYQPVEKPLYARSEHPSRTQESRHRSVLALMSKCLDAVLDYPLVLERLFQQADPFHALRCIGHEGEGPERMAPALVALGVG